NDFEYKQHRCIVIFTDIGHRCGYVSVNENSPLWCKDYSYFDVHGGITYSGGGKNSKYPVESDLYWFGFDCGHYYDQIDCEKLREYFPDGKFTESRISEAINFEGSEIRTLEYVRQECKNLV
ncbi:MAG: hypothetical protein NC124_20110, partial [Clostridium sp.]|nr:hypothetical protein [Clostridium sp.]